MPGPTSYGRRSTVRSASSSPFRPVPPSSPTSCGMAAATMVTNACTCRKCVIQRSRTPDPADPGQSFRLIPDGWGGGAGCSVVNWRFEYIGVGKWWSLDRTAGSVVVGDGGRGRMGRVGGMGRARRCGVGRGRPVGAARPGCGRSTAAPVRSWPFRPVDWHLDGGAGVVVWG